MPSPWSAMHPTAPGLLAQWRSGGHDRWRPDGAGHHTGSFRTTTSSTGCRPEADQQPILAMPASMAARTTADTGGLRQQCSASAADFVPPEHAAGTRAMHAYTTWQPVQGDVSRVVVAYPENFGTESSPQWVLTVHRLQFDAGMTSLSDDPGFNNGSPVRSYALDDSCPAFAQARHGDDLKLAASHASNAIGSHPTLYLANTLSHAGRQDIAVLAIDAGNSAPQSSFGDNTCGSGFRVFQFNDGGQFNHRIAGIQASDYAPPLTTPRIHVAATVRRNCNTAGIGLALVDGDGAFPDSAAVPARLLRGRRTRALAVRSTHSHLPMALVRSGPPGGCRAPPEQPCRRQRGRSTIRSWPSSTPGSNQRELRTFPVLAPDHSGASVTAPTWTWSQTTTLMPPARSPMAACPCPGCAPRCRAGGRPHSVTAMNEHRSGSDTRPAASGRCAGGYDIGWRSGCRRHWWHGLAIGAAVRSAGCTFRRQAGEPANRHRRQLPASLRGMQPAAGDRALIGRSGQSPAGTVGTALLASAIANFHFIDAVEVNHGQLLVSVELTFPTADFSRAALLLREQGGGAANFTSLYFTPGTMAFQDGAGTAAPGRPFTLGEPLGSTSCMIWTPSLRRPGGWRRMCRTGPWRDRPRHRHGDLGVMPYGEHRDACSWPTTYSSATSGTTTSLPTASTPR